MADTRRARETMVGQMHHNQQQQQQLRRGYTMSNTRSEKDEDLALFQDMRKRERTPYLLSDLEDAAKLGDLFDPIAAPCIERKGVGADLLNSDAEKNEYDWLLTPPGTPLFPSLDLESPAYTLLQQQQQGLSLMNHSLAAIKTSRIASNNQAEGPVLKSAHGNPRPNQKPSSTPLSSHSNSTPQSTPTTSGTPHSVKPSTPTKSSTSASKFSFRLSTPTQQSPFTTSSFSTGKASTAHSNQPSTPTNRPSTPTGRPSMPTLRRSSSSSTSSRGFSTVTTHRNPSPTRSTASSGASRGISPVRSQYKGASSPARGRSPVPTKERGSSSSPRKHLVIIPDGLPSDIPPNLRTTSDRGPSSAHHRHTAYSQGTTAQTPEVLDHSFNQPSSPNFIRSHSSISCGQDHLSLQSGRVSSDDDSSSYEVSSQSAVSSRGLTPERGRGYVQHRQSSVGNEDWRNTQSSFQARRSPSPRASPHFGTALTRKTPNTASRSSETQRPSLSGAFRPLMTKNSISTLYSSSNSATTRANTLSCRPLTPGSTASSEQGAASVAPDSEGDEDLLNSWGQLELSSLGGGHADILVLDKEHENLTSWKGLQQYEQDLKPLESTTVHSDMCDEADNYKSPGLSREAQVEEEESSSYSVSSSSVRELKTRTIHDEESNSESTGATTDWLYSDPAAKKGTNLNAHEKGREPLEPEQQILNLQAKEDIAALPEFWCNSKLDLLKELDTQRGRRALSFSSAVLKDESCGSENEVAIEKERESSPHEEKDTGISVDLMHVREKLMLLCENPNLEPPDLQQCSEQDKLEQPQSGSIVVEQMSVPPSLVMLPVHELCTSSELGSNNDVVTKEVETGSNTEAATEVMCVCNHAKHPEKCCDNPGCECCGTGHIASADAKIELQSLTHDESVESEAVKTAMSSLEARNALDMARQNNIWYMYKNSEDYVSSLCDNMETEFEVVSSPGGGRFSPKFEKEVQTVGSHHVSTSSTGVMQVLEELSNQQGIDDEASNHELQKIEDSPTLFTTGSEEHPDRIESKLETQQKEKEESQYGVVEQEDKSVETVGNPHAQCMEFPQLLNHVCEHASEVCWQEIKPGSGVLVRSADDSEAYILSCTLSDQESDPSLASTWGEDSKMKDRSVQEVMAQMATEDVLKQDNGETSTSELEHERGDPGDNLLRPLIAKALNEEVVECSQSGVTVEETEESEVQPELSSRWDEMESPGHHQDLKQSGPDPQALVASILQIADHDPQALMASTLETADPDPQALGASTCQTACSDPEALIASTLQIAGPDPEVLVAYPLQTVGLDPQALVASTLQTADPDPQALSASTCQTACPDPEALIASTLQIAGPDPEVLVAYPLQTVGLDPQALVASTLQTADPDPQAVIASTCQTVCPDPEALIASTLQIAGPDPEVLVASPLQTVGLDPQALVASTLQTADPDPQAVVASTCQTVCPDPEALIASTLQIAGPDPEVLVASPLQTVGLDPQALVASTLQTADPDPQAVVASTCQTVCPDPEALIASTLQIAGPDPEVLVASPLQTVGLDPQALVASTLQTADPDPQALSASTCQTVCPDPQALVASTLQIVGPDPEVLVASPLQTVGLDPQALMTSTLQTADPNSQAWQTVCPVPEALIASTLQTAGTQPEVLVASPLPPVGLDPEALVASTLQTADPDPEALVASTQETACPDPEALIPSTLQIVDPDPEALVASTQETACPDPEALVASTLQIADPDPEALVASTLQIADPDPEALVASTLQIADPDPEALVASTQETACPDPEALVASTQETACPNPEAVIASTLQIRGTHPEALVTSPLQTVGLDPEALIASTLQIADLDPEALVASTQQAVCPDPEALVGSTLQIGGTHPEALVASPLPTVGLDPEALPASTLEIAGPDPEALVASTRQTACPDPEALIASTLQIAGTDPEALVASPLQIVGLDPEALIASTLQSAGLDPEALIASTLQSVGLDPQALVASTLQIVGPDPQALVASALQIVHANQVADVIRSGEEDVEHDQANVHSDQKGLEQTRENEAAPETKEGDACSQKDEVQKIEKGMMIACLEPDFVDILEDGGGCTHLSHPNSSDAASIQSSVSGTKDHVDANMPPEEDLKQVQCSDTSDLLTSPPMMHSPVESEEMISTKHALPVMEAATNCVSEFDEVVKDLTYRVDQGTNPVGSVAFVANDKNDTLAFVKPVVKLQENSIRDDNVEKLVVEIVCMKGFDDGSKEVASCGAQKQGAEEGNQQSPCVEKKPNTLHLASLQSKAFEAPYSGLRGKAMARMQATFSKSESSKSSGSFLASSLDVSQSTDTISSCPSNSSWEDPQYSLSSGFWEMMKSSPSNTHVPDDVLDLPFPMELQKQGTSIKQGEDDVMKSSPSFNQCGLVGFGSVRANQPEDKSIIKQEMSSDENCLDYYSVDDVLLGGSETSAAGLQPMVENLKALSDPESKKEEEIMTETYCEIINARTSNQTLASEETVVEGGMLLPPKAVESSTNALDSVEELDGEMATLPNVMLSAVKDKIVENSESPSPNLSSFKFGHEKTSTTAEPEIRDMLNTHLEVLKDDDLPKEVPLPGKLPGKSQTMMPRAKDMDALNGMQLSKVNMVVRDGKSSMCEEESGDYAQPDQLTQSSTNGIRKMAKELNGQHRLSNITVCPGSVSEHFEWECSSLDKNSSCSSSSGSKHTDTAARVISHNITLAEVTDRILFCSSIVHDLVYEATELASKKKKNSGRTTASSPDLEAFSLNAVSQSGQEKYHKCNNNQNGHAQEESTNMGNEKIYHKCDDNQNGHTQEESTNMGNEKYHEYDDNQNGHAEEESKKVANGTTTTTTTAAQQHSITHQPNEGFQTPPGMRKSMSNPQAQVTCIPGEDAESRTRESMSSPQAQVVGIPGEDAESRTRKSMSSPQAQVMCIPGEDSSIPGEDAESTPVKEDIIMHPTETVRLNRGLNSTAKNTNEKCRCVIL